MPSVRVALGAALPLSLQVPDGDTGLYPQAHVYDPTGAEVGSSPFDLTHAALGRYTSAAYTPTVEGIFTAVFIIYTDAGHTTESQGFGRVDEAFTVLADSANIDRNADLIESQRGGHTWQGTEVFYVDPVNGSGGAAGTRDDPLDTVTEALSLVTDSAHSVIFLVSGAAAGPTTLDEAVTIAKRYTFLRGPGRDFIWTRSGAGDTVTVTAEGVELSGFQVETDSAGSGAGIRVNGGDFCRCRHLWTHDTRGSGFEISNSNHAIVEDCSVVGSGLGGSGHGIQVTPAGGTAFNVQIRRNHITVVPGDGIRLNGLNVDRAILRDNIVHNCDGWGINLIDTDHAFLWNNVLGENGSGDIDDQGTNTTITEGPKVDWLYRRWMNRLWLSPAGLWQLFKDNDVDVETTWDPILDAWGNPIAPAPGSPARRPKGV
jgi:hypothetical protein